VSPDIYNSPVIGYFPALIELEDGTPCLKRVQQETPSAAKPAAAAANAAAPAAAAPAPAKPTTALSKDQKENIKKLEVRARARCRCGHTSHRTPHACTQEMLNIEADSADMFGFE
jgi:hypothetical protein